MSVTWNPSYYPDTSDVQLGIVHDRPKSGDDRSYELSDNLRPSDVHANDIHETDLPGSAIGGNLPPGHGPGHEPPAPPLRSADVASFIINKMIGTGIFVNPPLVLHLAGNKGEALGLWIAGFIYTLISMIIYLEFARVLPHTGGELIYLDEVFRRPVLLAYTIYTFYFVFLNNTGTNALQFAYQVLVSANVKNESFVPDRRLLVFIAIVALSFFCLVHYFSARSGRVFNLIMAMFKVMLLFAVFVAGAVKASRIEHSTWNTGSSDPLASAAAFLLIVFSYGGWENATFVTGEVKNHQILRRGFVGAVLTVGVLYILVNLVFLIAVPNCLNFCLADAPTYVAWFFNSDQPATHGVIPDDQSCEAFTFTPYSDAMKNPNCKPYFGTEEARLTWSVLIAISASGSLVSVIYTCSRVKQAIGMANILPWSRIWRASSPFYSSEPSSDLTENPTPQGGLILHWIFSVVLICISISISDTSTAIGFPGVLQSYATGWVGVAISIGFPLLNILYDKIPKPLPTLRRWNRTNDGREILQPPWLQPLASKLFLGLLYLVCNLYIIIAPPISALPPGFVDGRWYATAVASVFAAAIIYYFSTIFSERYSILRLARVRAHVEVVEHHNLRYGLRKALVIAEKESQPSYLYWIFGGSDREHWPRRRFGKVYHWLLG